MNELEAILLGIVEGLTEYLPVSSTGHLIVTQRIMGIPDDEASRAYAICIQAGAILAVLGLYWSRVQQMVRSILRWGSPDPEHRAGAALVVHLIVAFMPAAVVGLLFDDWIEQKLFGLWPVVTALMVGGLAILWVSRIIQKRGAMGGELSSLTWRGALTIGLIQCLAMWPGTSRSLVTIVGGLLVGLEISAAVEFSFLLGMMTLLAATAYKAKDAGPVMLEQYGWTVMILGTIAAWIAAILAVKWMVGYLKRHSLVVFGYYRLLVGAAVAMAILSGYLNP